MCEPKAVEQGYGIHCCICLNLSTKRVEAITLMHGYAVCEEHMDVIKHHDFDFSRYILNARQTAKGQAV